MFLKFLDGDDCNTMIHRIPGASAVGVYSSASTSSPEASSEFLDSNCTSSELQEILQQTQMLMDDTAEITLASYSPVLVPQSALKQQRLSMETYETMNLSNAECGD
ncbi:uncharacterized protein LOC126484027 [Schistocerca serialis cubense]|uniref:uncharacterized protein LOC126484027 n=1 Tax=Schistocerca serialis cubense TaxID=2023355 RepID=UPI00214E833F|nr:uncharacterized protein LOC126484027 [Schistocerca serialis cubense]